MARASAGGADSAHSLGNLGGKYLRRQGRARQDPSGQRAPRPTLGAASVRLSHFSVCGAPPSLVEGFFVAAGTVGLRIVVGEWGKIADAPSAPPPGRPMLSLWLALAYP